jgi:hypothetical protein
MVLLYETFATYFTLITPASKMCACNMNSQRRSSREGLVAMMTAVVLLMRLDMRPQGVARETLPTHLAHRIFLLARVRMRFPVVVQTGAADKSLMAY